MPSVSPEDYIGSVPFLVYLNDTDCVTAEQPEPLAFMLPRTTFLVSVHHRIREGFAAHTVSSTQLPLLVWLTYQGEPVPWQYPIGAIADAMRMTKVSEASQSSSTAQNAASLASAYCYESNSSAFASPLSFVARVTCVQTEKPVGVVCTGQDALQASSGSSSVEPDGSQRSQGQTPSPESAGHTLPSEARSSPAAAQPPAGSSRKRIPRFELDFLKQLIKSSHSAVFNTIKIFMDTRTEVINDILDFATCINSSLPAARATSSSSVGTSTYTSSSGLSVDFAQVLRVYRERLATMRSASGEMNSYLFMMSYAQDPTNLSSKNRNASSTQFTLVRLPVERSGTSASPVSHGSRITYSDPQNAGGSTLSTALYGVHTMTLGAAMWRILLRPIFESAVGGNMENPQAILEYLHDKQVELERGGGSGAASPFTHPAPALEHLHNALLADVVTAAFSAASLAEDSGEVAEAARPTVAQLEACMIEKFIAAHDDRIGGMRVPYVSNHQDAVARSPSRRVAFVIQGLEPLFRTPVHAIVSNLTAADLRVYVAVALV